MCVTCIGWARKQAIYGEHGRGGSVRQGGRFVGNVCEPASHLSLVKHRLAQKLHPVSWPEESSFSSSPFSGLAHKVTFKQACSDVHCACNSPSPPALLLKRFHSLSCSNSSTPESLLLRIASLNSTLSLKHRH